MVNAINGDLLSENPMQGRDAVTGRILSTDRFKGFLPSELREVRDEQTAQVIEKEMTRERRLAEERLSAKAVLDTDRAVLLQARQQERMRKERLHATADANRRLASEQHTQRSQRNTQFTSNAPTEAFFDQFNRSTR